jgi:hypothetical protein
MVVLTSTLFGFFRVDFNPVPEALPLVCIVHGPEGPSHFMNLKSLPYGAANEIDGFGSSSGPLRSMYTVCKMCRKDDQARGLASGMYSPWPRRAESFYEFEICK